MSPDPLTTLGTADRDRLEALLVEFDLGWGPDQLPAAIAKLPAEGRLRAAGLRELIRIDMERHARGGRPVAWEEYIRRYPEVLDAWAGPDPPTPLGDVTTAYHPYRPAAGDLPDPFGRYRILRPLGRGGMGRVYLARDTELDRLVALKVPHFRPDDTDALERFAREARAAAAIDHPNVCRVYDVGRVDDTPFLTMAYVDGRTLADEMRAAPLSPRRAAEVVRDVARGIAEAHRLGVVHRDLKPGNILLQSPQSPVPSPQSEGNRLGTGDSGLGTPIVTDFGLARRAADDLRLTASGAILGTPLYMSPEQVAGHTDRIGPASDVYSLGVVLYELLATRPPFGLDRADVMAGTLSKDPPPPSGVRPGLDPRLDAIVLKAMAKRPDDRFTMPEFADALDAWLTDDAPRPARRPLRRRLIGVAIAAIALSLFLPAAVKLGCFPGPHGPDAPTHKAGNGGAGGGGPVGTGAITDADRLVAIGLSPDGRLVHTAALSKVKLVVSRWDVASGREEPTTIKQLPYKWAAFSPDGRRVLIGGGIQSTDLYPVAGGEPVARFVTGDAQVGAVSGNGKFAIVGLNTLKAPYQARVFDTGTKQAVGPAYTGPQKDFRAVALSDNGTWAFAVNEDRYAMWEVSSNKPRISEGSNAHQCAVFVPGTQWCVVGNAAGAITLFDVSKPALQLLDYPTRHQDGVTALAASPDGKRVVSASLDGSVRVWEAATGTERWVLHEGSIPVACMAVSPDGKRVAAGFADRTWRVWDLPEGP